MPSLPELLAAVEKHFKLIEKEVAPHPGKRADHDPQKVKEKHEYQDKKDPPKEQDLKEYTDGKTKDTAPRAHALSRVKIRKAIYEDIIKQVLDAEKLGISAPEVDAKVIEFVSRLAHYGRIKPQEALDVIAALGGVNHADLAALHIPTTILDGKNQPIEVEVPIYARAVNEVLNQAADLDDRREMVAASSQMLTEAEKAGALNAGASKAIVEVLEGEAESIRQEYIVDPDHLESVIAQRWVEEMRREYRNKITLQENPDQLKHVEHELEEDKRIPENDRNRLVDALAEQKIEASRQQMDVVKDLQQEWQRNEVGITKMHQELLEEQGKKYDGYDEVENKQGKKVKQMKKAPPEINQFMTDLTAAIGFWDSTNPDLSRPLRANELPIDGLRKRLEQLVLDGHLTAAEGARHSTLIDRIAIRGRMVRTDRDFTMGDVLRAGLREEHSITYQMATDPDRFMLAFEQLPTLEAKAQFVKNFRTQIGRMADDLLSVIDSDPNAFADQTFNQLIHEPVYNKMVDGLLKIQNELLRWEQRTGSGLKITEREFNLEHVRKVGIERNQVDPDLVSHEDKEIDPHNFLEKLRGEIIRKRTWKRYNHNVKVMIGTHNFESWQKYAETIHTEEVSKLFETEPLLEIATSAHEEYVFVRYGMSFWKAPLDVFVATRTTDQPAVDAHVRDVLMRIPALRDNPQKIDELVGMSWVAMSTLLTDMDIVLTSGAPHLSGPTQPYGPIHYNPLITAVKRFHAELITAAGDLGYHFLGVKMNSNRRKYRSPAEEMYEGEKYMKSLDKRERDRVITFDEFEKSGLPLVELLHDFVIMSGGLGNRMLSWRGAAIDKYFIHDRAGKLDRSASIANLMRINPQFANAYITRWYAGKEIGKTECRALRTQVWNYVLKGIAPQAAVILSRDLLFHDKLARLKLKFDGRVVSIRELAESWARSQLPDSHEKFVDDPRLTQLILDSETVTRWLLNGSDGLKKMETMEVLGNDNAKWAQALMFNLEKLPQGMTREQVLERAGRVRLFMQTIRDQVADGLIKNGVNLQIADVGTRKETIDGKTQDVADIKYISKKIGAWQDAIHIRSFPGHYTVRRYTEWEKMGERFVARLLGDNSKLVETFGKGFTEHKANVIAMQEEPEKMKEMKFAPIRKSHEDLAEMLRQVHGSLSNIELQSSVHMMSYILHEAYIKWFHKGSGFKYIPFDPLGWPIIRNLFRESTWVHTATESTASEMESQETRIMIDKAIDANLIAPYHGYRTMKNRWINDVVNDAFPALQLGRFLPKRRMPYHELKPAGEVLEDMLGRKEILGFKLENLKFPLPVLAPRSPYNAYRLRKATGAEDWNLALNIAPEYVMLAMILLTIAALQKSFEENSKE